MADIRSKQNFLDIPPVNSLFFEVKSVGSFFSVNLTWFYKSGESTDIIGFKIYKATMQKPILNKNYNITQRTLEKTTKSKNFQSLSNVLYNKSLFSQNSKVKFSKSNSNQHDKKESDLSSYSFQSIAFVASNSNSNCNFYKFIDKNVKFGECYVYYVTAVTKSFKETTPNLIFVPVEFFNHPKEISFFKTSESSQGILLIFGTMEKNIAEFIIFKKGKNEEQFHLLDKIDANTTHRHYIDTDVFPKTSYLYKIYVRDIWGNVSLTSKEMEQSFTYIPFGTSLENVPNLSLETFSEGFKINLENKSKNITSVRIERKDDWKFDKFYELKSENSIFWENNIFFKDGKIEHLDKTIQKNRAYSYKITCFNKNCLPICYLFIPPITFGENFTSVKNIQKINEICKINFFTIDIVNKNQLPVNVKVTWDIEGKWSYMLLNNGVEKIKIDNLHKTAFLNNFLSNRQYNLSVELFNLNNEKIQEKFVATIKT